MRAWPSASVVPLVATGVSVMPSLSTITTDATGFFEFDLLPIGSNYTITATNYTAQTVTNLQKNVKVDFISAPLPAVSIDRTSLTFAATTAGAAFASQTASQTVRLKQGAGAAVTWTATPSKPWLTVTPASGTGSAALSVAVKFDSSLPASGTATGAITLALTGASTTAGPINVTLTVVPSTTLSPPFGSFDTPTGDATVSFIVV